MLCSTTILALGFAIRSSLVAFVVWAIFWYAYRLTLHPLAKYPGPKLAAISKWYEFYYDVVLKGQYVFRLQELHKKYGPIIRISPEELHIDDPEFFETLYTKNGRLHKHQKDEHRFGNPNSVFATGNANVHRIRRNALNPFFSKRNVLEFQPFVHEKVARMMSNLATFRGTGKPVRLDWAYMALAGDVIMEFCYGYNFDHVESKGFEENFHELLVTSSQSGVLGTHFPFFLKALVSMPEWFVVWSTPLFALLFQLYHSVERDVKARKQQEASPDAATESRRSSVMQHLLDSDLPPTEKADQRLIDEGVNFVGAGTSTTGWALSVASFHIIKQRPVFQRLRKELEEAVPDPKAADASDWSKLEQCEYLTACAKEGIRLSMANVSRLTRISDNVIEYGTWQIPPGTAVGMCLVDLNSNKDIFPNPKTYNPERWLKDAKTLHGEPTDKYFFGFMKGYRNCLGVNLAWLELYTALAGVFRNFNFELFETGESDVELKHDFMVPSPKLDTQGIRVLVK